MKKTALFSLLTGLLATGLLTGCGSGNETVRLIPVRSGTTYGYIDREGKMIINPQFGSATVFRDGLALVKTSGDDAKWGYIDEEGKYVIQPTYRQATLFSEGIAFVVRDNLAPTAIDTDGDTLFTVQNAERVSLFHEGMAAFSVASDKEEKWGFIDKEGNVVIQPQFASVGHFSEGKCAAGTEASSLGYIDKEGKYLINPQFKVANEFKNGRAIAGTDKQGLIDEEGKYLINPQFATITNDGDQYVVMQDGKFGWIDEEGKFVINPQFTLALPFHDSKMAPVMSGTSWGYIDKDGKFTINPQFDGALGFDGDMALATSDKKVGFIDEDGKYQVNPQFDAIAPDYVSFRFGRTEGVVQTDYFNVGAIVQRITQDIDQKSVKGVSFRTPMSDILTRFNKQASDFNAYNAEHPLTDADRVANVATVQLMMIGRPFVQRQNGYYYEQVFDRQATPNGLLYVIRATGKGYGKQDQILKVLDEQGFTGFTRDAQASNEERKLFTSTDLSLLLFKRHEDIAISIAPRTAGTPPAYIE